ncbi:four helix bundle protein [Alkaliflexus imshenetskii]|uniref:four helix bundle protein n=1 Tax=Alkaliflexus imshenetskii TaxID=286730 RepID=UPI0005C52165|nr:four helix bundle protein [Alkaliflexus imshenetskii]
MSDYNKKYEERTKLFAIEIVKFYSGLSKSTETQVIGKQLLRSGTSVAANFRAACRARSTREYFSKLCIVVEECDETLFWLELLSECALPINNQTLGKLL